MMWTKDNIPDQTGKIVMVTGANAGIGYETALALHEKGAHVVLACRSIEKAEEARRKIQENGGKGTLETGLLDLSSLAAVKRFADDFKQKHDRLDVLINNAGVMIPPHSKTEEGYELQFGVNFLAHFALTGLLYPLLKNNDGARVVTLSSGAYLHGSIAFDNLKSENSYEPMREYSQSKLADVLLSVELDRRIKLAGDQVLSIAAQPGANKTELSRHMNADEFDAAVERVGELMEPWQGALSSLYGAVATEARPGRLYGPDQDGGYRGYPVEWPLNENALDEEVALKLWELAEEVTGVHYPG